MVRRTTRRLLLALALVLLLVVGGGAALVLSARPDLDDARRTVDARWSNLRGPLATRYEGLTQVTAALTAAGAGERSYTVDLAAGLRDWEVLTRERSGDPAAEAAVANRLEGLAARVRTNVAGSARLARDPAVGGSFGAFDTALVPPPAIRAYNRAVRRYQGTRTETLKRLPADLLGFDARPLLVVGLDRGA